MVAVAIRLPHEDRAAERIVTTHRLALEDSPGDAAAALAEQHSTDPAWLDAFAAELDRRRQGKALSRILDVWGVSQSEAGRRFGVSRQAVAKWLAGGLPADRVESVADVSAATDLLVRRLKRDRIPAVVRRPVPALDGDSLLDLISHGDFRRLVDVCRQMFDFAAVQR